MTTDIQKFKDLVVHDLTLFQEENRYPYETAVVECKVGSVSVERAVCRCKNDINWYFADDGIWIEAETVVRLCRAYKAQELLKEYKDKQQTEQEYKDKYEHNK